MQKGYLPYMEPDRERPSRQRGSQLSFDFPSRGEDEPLSPEQVDELYRAVLDFVESKRQARPKRGAARIADSFYSFNVLPPRNISKYLEKAGIYDSEAASLRSDWEKIGLDLWSSVLRMHHKRVAGE